MSLKPVEDAIVAILARVPPVTAETVPLAKAAGRVLAAPVIATHDQPPFDASAMDGYAVRAADAVDGATLRVVGVSQAGARFQGELGTGEAVRIFTGAPLPHAADTVIMQEQAVVEGDRVGFTAPVRPGHSVRLRGHDFASGDQLLAPGTLLGPLQLTVAAAANAGTVSVARRPSIALLATGDELVPPGSPLAPDQIVASNTAGLLPLLAPYAERVTDHGIAPDVRAELRDRLSAIFASKPDVLVTTGGASVGEHDLVQDVLKELGVTLDFWRINMRPGKPLMFGVWGKTLVFGLPGNPVSAIVTALVFIRPALRRWAGYVEPANWRLPLAAPTPANSARRHFMRGRLLLGAEGPQVLPILETDSGHTSSMAAADMLIVQPEHEPGQPRGAAVEVMPIFGF